MRTIGWSSSTISVQGLGPLSVDGAQSSVRKQLPTFLTDKHTMTSHLSFLPSHWTDLGLTHRRVPLLRRFLNFRLGCLLNRRLPDSPRGPLLARPQILLRVHLQTRPGPSPYTGG